MHCTCCNAGSVIAVTKKIIPKKSLNQENCYFTAHNIPGYTVVNQIVKIKFGEIYTLTTQFNMKMGRMCNTHEGDKKCAENVVRNRRRDSRRWMNNIKLAADEINNE